LGDNLAEEIKKTIEKTIKETIEHELGSYKVPKEQHYQDHLFISEWRQWQESIRNSFWRSVVAIMIASIASLLVLGFILFGKEHLR